MICLVFVVGLVLFLMICFVFLMMVGWLYIKEGVEVRNLFFLMLFNFDFLFFGWFCFSLIIRELFLSFLICWWGDFGNLNLLWFLIFNDNLLIVFGLLICWLILIDVVVKRLICLFVIFLMVVLFFVFNLMKLLKEFLIRKLFLVIVILFLLLSMIIFKLIIVVGFLFYKIFCLFI